MNARRLQTITNSEVIEFDMVMADKFSHYWPKKDNYRAIKLTICQLFQRHLCQQQARVTKIPHFNL